MLIKKLAHILPLLGHLNILTPQILPPQPQEIKHEMAVWSLVCATLGCCLV